MALFAENRELTVRLVRSTFERMREHAPMHEIAQVMDLHTGEPLEGGRGDVVIIAHSQDGRVGIKAR